MDPETQQLLSIIFRIVQIVAAAMLVLTAAIAAIAFLRALWMRHRPLRPLQWPSRPPSQSLESEVALACKAGFQSLGFWTDAEDGFDKGQIYTLMLSPDACILFCVRHDRISPPYKFISPLADGHWVITGIADDDVDLCGLDDEQWFPRGFDAMLSRHQARIAAPSSALLAFSPDGMTRQLREHEQARLDRLVAAKLARFLSEQQDQWRYTLRGAVRVTRECLRRFKKMLADQRKQPAKLPLEK